MNTMRRLATMSIEEVLPTLKTVPYVRAASPSERREHPRIREFLGGYLVCTNSLRLVTFKTKGTVCVKCGIDGKFFAVECPEDQCIPHLNLYAMKDGSEVLMTHDHILARSLGGPDTLVNTQTMCSPCNTEKSKLEQLDRAKLTR